MNHETNQDITLIFIKDVLKTYIDKLLFKSNVHQKSTKNGHNYISNNKSSDTVTQIIR